MKIHNKDSGQGLVEYALIMLLVAIIVIVALALFGPAIGNLYSSVIQNIQHAQAGKWQGLCRNQLVVVYAVIGRLK